MTEGKDTTPEDLVAIAHNIRMMSGLSADTIPHIHSLEPLAKTIEAIGNMLYFAVRNHESNVMDYAQELADLAEVELHESAVHTYMTIKDNLYGGYD